MDSVHLPRRHRAKTIGPARSAVCPLTCMNDDNLSFALRARAAAASGVSTPPPFVHLQRVGVMVMDEAEPHPTAGRIGPSIWPIHA